MGESIGCAKLTQASVPYYQCGVENKQTDFKNLVIYAICQLQPSLLGLSLFLTHHTAIEFCLIKLYYRKLITPSGEPVVSAETVEKP